MARRGADAAGRVRCLTCFIASSMNIITTPPSLHLPPILEPRRRLRAYATRFRVMTPRGRVRRISANVQRYRRGDLRRRRRRLMLTPADFAARSIICSAAAALESRVDICQPLILI